MSVYLKSIEVKKLFGEKNIRWDLSDVSVLVGKNGAGKSTILRSIYELITNESKDSLNLSTEFTLNFIDRVSLQFKKGNLFTEKEMSVFLENLKNTSELLKERKIKEKKYSKYKNKSKNSEIEERIVFDKFNSLYDEIFTHRNHVSSIFLSEVIKTNEEAISDISVEMISTINMSANSINELTKSDGNTTTLLDLELNTEMEKLRLTAGNIEMESRIVLFIDELNDFFYESNKLVSFNGERVIIKNKKTNNDINIKNLSSGERQLLFILIKTLNMSVGKSILLMDEPEISLHMSWQKKLISSIKRINDTCQIIIVTHSASILAKGWLDSFVDIKNIELEDL